MGQLQQRHIWCWPVAFVPPLITYGAEPEEQAYAGYFEPHLGMNGASVFGYGGGGAVRDCCDSCEGQASVCTIFRTAFGYEIRKL
jgi:hypothetical protein